MLLGTVLFTCAGSVICAWGFFSRSPITATYVLAMKNYTEHDLQIEKLHFFHSFLFCSLGSIPPFLCFLVSSWVLIVSLRCHMWTMRAQNRDSCDPSPEAHSKVLKCLISFLGVYAVSLSTALLLVPPLVLSLGTGSHPNLRQCQAEESCGQHLTLGSERPKGKGRPQGRPQDSRPLWRVDIKWGLHQYI